MSLRCAHSSLQRETCLLELGGSRSSSSVLRMSAKDPRMLLCPREADRQLWGGFIKMEKGGVFCFNQAEW